MLEQIKRFGERLIGHKKQVDFRESVERLTTTGLSQEVAEKRVFKQYSDQLEREVATNGLGQRPEAWGRFAGSLHELFPKDLLLEFDENAENPAIFSMPPMPSATGAEIADARDFYESKNGVTPSNLVVTKCVEEINLIYTLIHRVNSDLARFAGSASDIESLMRSNPEVGADIGRCLLGYKQLLGHDKMMSKDAAFQKSIKELKESLSNAIGALIKTPFAFIRDFLMYLPSALSLKSGVPALEKRYFKTTIDLFSKVGAPIPKILKSLGIFANKYI